jgi:hypothetical protein
MEDKRQDGFQQTLILMESESKEQRAHGGERKAGRIYRACGQQG